MIDELARLGRAREKLLQYLGRSGCHPCDRAEAGHQLNNITKQLEAVQASLNRYNRHE